MKKEFVREEYSMVHLENKDKNLLKMTGRDDNMFDIEEIKNLLIEDSSKIRTISEKVLESDRKISDNYTKEEIKDDLIEILRKLSDIDSKKENFVEKELRKLNDKFNNEIKEYNVFTGVENLKIAKKLSVNNVTFIEKTEFFEIFNELFEDVGEEQTQIYKKRLENDFNNVETIAKVTILGKHEYAHHYASNKINNALNIINLSKENQKLPATLIGDIKGLDSRDFFIEPGFHCKRFYPSDLIHPIDLNISDIENLNEGYMETLAIIISKTDLSDFEKRIVIAINNYNESLKIPFYILMNQLIENDFSLVQIPLHQKLVFLTTSIESLLNIKDEPIKANLSYLAAMLLENELYSFKQIYDLVIELYKKRSDVVHGNNPNIDYEKFLSFERIVKDIIFKLLDLNEEFNIETNENFKIILNYMKSKKEVEKNNNKVQELKNKCINLYFNI